jgi:uncharacterized protein
MRIHVDEIPEAGRLLQFQWGEERFRQFMSLDDPLAICFDRPLSIDLEIHNHPDHLRVLGSIRASFEMGCHRCLESFPWLLEQSVDVFLLRQKKAQGQEDEDLEPDQNDPDQLFFDGEEIDIDLLVAEQIFLALPIKALCSEHCQGICPRCGVNLNLETCRCAGSQKESPFTLLQAIRQQLPDKTSP